MSTLSIYFKRIIRNTILLLCAFSIVSCGGARSSNAGPAYIRASAPTIDDCPLDNIICVGPGLEFDTNLGQEAAIRNAVDSAQAGNTVAIHSGVYRHIDNNRNLLAVRVSGTAAQPIVIEALRGHKVVFEGWGFQDIPGQTPSRDAEIIISITGDYVHIYNIEVKNSTRYGIDMSGNYGVLEDIVAHDCWWSNLVIGGGARSSNNNTIRSVESYRSHHGGGIMLTRQNTDTTLAANNTIENSISYNNGYMANGQKVPIVPGDPTGGGNSDGIVVGKDCYDQAAPNGVNNLCPNATIRNNVTWHNADDGIDNSLSVNAVIADNISFNSGVDGGRGYKGLRNVNGGIIYIGNISMNNADRGYELRTADEIYIHHNLSAHHANNGNHGLLVVLPDGVVNANPNIAKINNNLIYDNYNGIVTIPGFDRQANLVLTPPTTITPQLPNPSFNATSVNLNFPAGISSAQKVEFIRDQFKAAFTPQPGSDLIDAGTVIAGVHCATADDDAATPMPANDTSCRHWRGSAPDIGVFEAL